MTLRDLRLRVRALLARRRAERELHDELEFHLEMETRKHVAAGLSPDDARARARARFGSAAVAAEAVPRCPWDRLHRDVPAGRRLCGPRLRPRAHGRAHHRRHRGARPGTRRRGLHDLQPLRLPRRCRAGPRRALRRGASPVRRLGPRPLHAAGVRGAPPRDRRLLRCLRRAVRRHVAHRRPHDGRPHRHRQLLPGGWRGRGARAHDDARRRHAARAAGDCAQPQRLDAVVCRRPECRRPQCARQRVPLRDCRRDAGRISRALVCRARLLGAAVARRPVSTLAGRTRTHASASTSSAG